MATRRIITRSTQDYLDGKGEDIQQEEPKINRGETEEKSVLEDVSKEDHDVITPHDDVETLQREGLDHDLFYKLYDYVVSVETSKNNTPVYLSNKERKQIDEYLFYLTNKKDIKISISKLVRVCILYMLKTYQSEMTSEIIKHFKLQRKKDI